MARKTARKSGPKTARKPAKPARKASGKPAAKAPRAKASPKAKPARRTGATAGAPPITDVSTGPGPSPAEIGARICAAFNAGTGDEVAQAFWSEDIQSIEGMGKSFNGRASAIAKGEQWMAENEVLGAAAEGPYVGATGFALKFTMDVKNKASGQTTRMTEVGVYTVRNGKIVCEEFMYAC